MTVQHGDNCMNQRVVYEWVEIFKEGRANIVEDKHSDRSGSVVCVEVKQIINQRIRDKKRISADVIASEISIMNSKETSGPLDRRHQQAGNLRTEIVICLAAVSKQSYL
jgi:hypothetical protein